MNWDRIEGDWKQFVGKVKEKWAKLTDDDIAAINGKREAGGSCGKHVDRAGVRCARVFSRRRSQTRPGEKTGSSKAVWIFSRRFF